MGNGQSTLISEERVEQDQVPAQESREQRARMGRRREHSSPMQRQRSDERNLRRHANIQSPTHSPSASPPHPPSAGSGTLVPIQTSSAVLNLSGQNLAELDHSMLQLLLQSSAAEICSHTELVLSKNRLKRVPEELAKLWPNLERLALGSNMLTEIPRALGDLKQLLWLDFTHNRITAIDDSLGDLPRLTSLGASDCRLSEFPVCFTRLGQLRKLGVFNNLITSLPPQIGNMHALTKLDLSGNLLQTLPAEIGNLTHLTWLNISNNQLRQLPESIGSLVNLKELGLAHNKLQTLPASMQALRSLHLLTVFNNELRELGDWICGMDGLEKLDISGNQLQSLPRRILTMPRLDLLNVRGNKLRQLHAPDDGNPFVTPEQLVVLDVRDNCLDALPIGVRGPALCELKCSGNPFEGRHGAAASAAGGLAKQRPPAMLDSACAVILRHTLHMPRGRTALLKCITPHLQLTAFGVWAGEQGAWCYHCQSLFLHRPRMHVECRESSDCMIVPFVMPMCSARCVQDRSRVQDGAAAPAHPEPIADWHQSPDAMDIYPQP